MCHDTDEAIVVSAGTLPVPDATHIECHPDDAMSPMPMVEDAAVVSSEPSVTKPMSKKAMKKAAKAERFAALKLERRAREKEARKEKKRVLSEKRAAGELDDEGEAEEKKRQAKRPKIDFGGNVVVDLGFDDMMSDKEITSLCSQLAYTYSVNRRAFFPFTLIFTSLNGRTYERLEGLSEASYKRWSNTVWHSEGHESLWIPDPDSTLGPTTKPQISPLKLDPEAAKAPVDGDLVAASLMATGGSDQRLNTARFPKTSIVYLTADTEDELTEVKSDETYIIGGICDHNRYKNLCLNKARQAGIRTARLPIGRFLASLPTRKVLTVNQVFEILVKWVETKDWEEALYSVIPKRKFQQGSSEREEPTKTIDVSVLDSDVEASP